MMNSSFAVRLHLNNIFLIVIFLVFTVLQGCESTIVETNKEVEQVSISTPEHPKLRHANLIDNALRTRTDAAGKSATNTADLVVTFASYEADGITSRSVDRTELTRRILEEYGVTRRILSQYGISKRILERYEITRRVLNRYGITRRMLSRYGITPRLLRKYNDVVSDVLLENHNLTDEALMDEGFSKEDIENFNRLSALLNEYDITLEEFVEEEENYAPAIRMKVFVDGVQLRTSLSIDALFLDEFLSEIGDDEDILYVEPDAVFETGELGSVKTEKNKSQIIPWGITNIEAPLIDKKDEKKANYQDVYVFIFDSGAIEKDKWDDLDFSTKKDFTLLFDNQSDMFWDEQNVPDVSGYDPKKGGNAYDGSGHGAHEAGIIGAENNDFGIVGVASGISLHSLKVLTDEGKTDITTLLAAVDYVTRKKIKKPDTPVVVNMSLGVDIGTTEYNVLDEAIEASIKAGVIYVVAAGNDGNNAETISPAHVEGVITVGSYNQANVVSSFSNYGPAIDILAPGENIISLSHLVEETENAQAVLASGTSYAAPYVTGAVAHYLGMFPKATAEEVKMALIDTSTPTLSNLPPQTSNRALNVANLLELAESKSDKKMK